MVHSIAKTQPDVLRYFVAAPPTKALLGVFTVMIR
jgi:hypothetical protein